MPQQTQIKEALWEYSSPEKAKILSRFFKRKHGEYAEKDIFIGVKTPEIRYVAKVFHNISLQEIIPLLQSSIHEERLLAIFLLIQHYKESNTAEQTEIVKGYYLENIEFINNWDLVDQSAHQLLGHWLIHRKKTILNNLAFSSSIWKRRIAIVSTFAFIRQSFLKETFEISEILLSDKEDLIHKATGWMLREAGKKNLPELKRFIQIHRERMPRTMLRYAIEKFPEKERKTYLSGNICPVK